MPNNMTRRQFIKHSSALSASVALALSGCGGKNETQTVSPPSTPTPSTGNKALVYLILGGGNDSFNMLVPTNDSSYSAYQQSRSNLALDKKTLLPLEGFSDAQNQTFGLHPSMPEVQKLFDDKKLAFIANIAPLVEPTNKADFLANRAKLPLGLLSHADQFRHWQTSLPNQRTNMGWFGKMADSMQPNRSKEQISMNISLGGTNILQLGEQSKEYSITQNGSVGLIINEEQSALNKEIFKSFNTLLNRQYSNAFDKTYIDTTLEAQAQHETFTNATQGVNIKTPFSNTQLSQEFKMVAKSIVASNNLNTPQQTFFLHYYGWDHHDELLNNHAKMLKVVSQALGEFDKALSELGIQEQVITFVGSDFGRTLGSNGNGTDHGWGGNVMVMGQGVKGGQVYGEYPTLALNSELDVGGGVLIPTTSTDEMFAELALWFGVQKQNLPNILPNIEQFYSLKSSSAPIGFIG